LSPVKEYNNIHLCWGGQKAIGSVKKMSRNILRRWVLPAVFLIAATVCVGAYSGGSGDPNDPYQIADVNDLLALGADTNDYAKCFIMTADINLQGQVFTTSIIAPDNDSSSGFQGTTFTGKFDGNGHTIQHFKINGGSNDYLGLFGMINPGGEIKNLGLEDCNIGGAPGTEYAGGLVAYNIWGSLSHCYSMAVVRGSFSLGGLVGHNDKGAISYCYSTSDVNGSQNIGGLVGYHTGADINHCNSAGSASGLYQVGGLVGTSYMNGRISHSYSTSAVNGSSNSSYIGGLVGISEYGNLDGNSITYCYSTGPVAGRLYVGGLVGQNSAGGIAYCYSTSAVNGFSGAQYIAGLVGFNSISNISNCYSDGLVIALYGPRYIAGLVGYNDYYNNSIINCYSNGLVITLNSPQNMGGLIGYAANRGAGTGSVTGCFWDTQTYGQTTSAGGTGKTSAEMKTLSTFTSAGWNFVQTWDIEENQTYPFFRIYLAGDINHDGEVDFYDFAVLASEWLE
jgi:hypothetical protein